MNLSARAPLLAAAAAVALAAGTAADPLAAQTATSAEETIRAAVDAITGTPPLHRTHWGIEVYDPVDDRILVERNPHHLFVPASNTKVVTVVAALGLLGPDWRYVTAIEAAGVQDGVASSLVVRGSGDPTLSSHFHDDPLAPLDSLADSLAAAGIRRIEGPVIVDQSRFDSVLTHPAWERFDLDWYYAAPVAPFAVMEGAYEVVIRPGSAGAPATVELPRVDGLVGVDAAVITADGAGRWDDQLRRIPGADSVVLRGSVGTDIDADTSWIAQDDPGRLAGRALVRALEGAGIAVLGGVEVRYGGAPAAGTDGATEAVVRVGWRSPPLRDIVPLSLERSDNWLSEQIVRTLGAELGEVGSWSEGTRIVEEYLADVVGIDPDAIYLRDGSGLSPQNLVTPHALVQMLRHADAQPWREAFRSALAEPGEVESTLDRRLVNGAWRIQAKTGTIRHTNALSGYLRTPGGRELVFSILTNATGLPSRRVRAAMDRIIQTISDNWSQR